MTDWDGKKYVAVFEQFKVEEELHNIRIIIITSINHCINTYDFICIKLQVDSVLEDYRLTVGDQNQKLSTLGDSMYFSDGEKFTAK